MLQQEQYSSGQSIHIQATIQNTGDTLWLAEPRREFGGYVTLGAKLCEADGRMLTDALGRVLLPHDVAPGEIVHLETVIVLPSSLPPGSYTLRLDMVDELIAWFEQLGSPVCEHRFTVPGSGQSLRPARALGD